jgi:hypothetical protein|tara:strand:+ start:822 stop:1016 length:195 start_codon:yes stop_codon:yes gene_type:complete
MKEITQTQNFRLEDLTIKEIMKKYPDKIVDVYAEGSNAVLVLDTCRIKFINTKIKEHKPCQEIH